ncbi:ABC transporter permease subunit [Nonomuraea rhodomycinica]|uniref:ABC transporter permease subunit n=1 Tax=Nonomuraea rhodomycinica TaxID=1712872 RepID=A0A7Y6IVX2_9ACTN|nr:ABC transporter permease subunit [Nonomuraea rhodomycinica]NUW44798.1 ABC transporter permease subunit [Nonomuraea rhodomycinica]
MIDVIRSEWTKLRSVRSTMWTLGTAVLFMLAIGILMSIAVKRSATGPVPSVEATGISLSGYSFAALAVAALGALVVTSEYRTGAIRVSYMAVPRRLRLLAGKLVVFTAVALAACMAASFATFFVGQAILGGASLGDPGVLRTVTGTGLFLTACGLFGLALGALVRHTPGAIVSAIGLILVLPQVTRMLPGEWGRTVNDWFTSNAGVQVAFPTASSSLGPWSGFAVYLGWITVTLAVACVLTLRRDA